MKIVYQGPFADGVYIPVADGSEIQCTPGEPVEVSAELGASLLEQPDNWKRADGPAKSAARTAAEKEV